MIFLSFIPLRNAIMLAYIIPIKKDQNIIHPILVLVLKPTMLIAIGPRLKSAKIASTIPIINVTINLIFIYIIFGTLVVSSITSSTYFLSSIIPSVLSSSSPISPVFSLISFNFILSRLIFIVCFICSNKFIKPA